MKLALYLMAFAVFAAVGLMFFVVDEPPDFERGSWEQPKQWR